jgi:hypothetical protein
MTTGEVAAQAGREQPQLWDVKALLATYSPSYYDTWDEAFKALNAHPPDRRIIETLIAHLATGAQFREPIILDNDELLVRNGTHRVAASAEAGAATIATLTDFPEPDYGAQVVTVTFTVNPVVPGDFSSAGEAAEAAGEFAFEWLSSLPLDADTWANCDIMSSTNRPGPHARVDGTWYVQHSRAGDLVAALTALAAEHGHTLTDVVIDLELDLDDETE